MGREKNDAYVSKIKFDAYVSNFPITKNRRGAKIMKIILKNNTNSAKNNP
ncbi:MAG TPA: hypothetical protein PLI57_03710 [Spirochaetota bacterium]|nr:hypothetical protein [Spirochaetota bacterium]